MRLAVALALFLASALSGARADSLTTKLTEEGVASIRCGGLTGELSAIVLGPEWSYASQSAARMDAAFPAGTIRAGSPVTARGSIEMPEGATGRLAFEQDVSQNADRVGVSYALTPTESSPIWLLAIVLRVPAVQLDGKEGRILGVRNMPLRFEAGSRVDFSGAAYGVSLPTSAGLCSVVADIPAAFEVVDARQWGGDAWEFRFILLGRGRTIPGATIRRAITAGVIAEDELKGMTTLPPVSRSQPFALARPNGSVRIWRDQPIADCQLIIFGPDWQGAALTNDAASAYDPHSRTVHGTIEVRGAGDAQATCTVKAESSDSAVRLRYRVEFPQEVELRACRVAFGLPISRHQGREVLVLPSGAAPPARFAVPPEYPGTPGIWSGEARGVEVAPASDDHIVITSARPIHVNVQDNREWGGDEIEVGFHLPLPEGPVPAGYTAEGELTVAMPGLQFVPDSSLAPSSNQTEEWFAFPLAPDAAPVDLSWLNHKPAGAHGFVIVRDGQLAFEDGTPARFWGTCFSAGACFPKHENAEIIARRLAQFGVNIARLHHMDSNWGDVRLLDASAGDTRHFDLESLDRLDYFIHCLKREGVYVYLDNLVSRQFTAKDGVEAADKLEFKASPYSFFDPRLIELQREFCSDLWRHANPYTGLRYCDDPAIALTEVVNEADAFTSDVVVEPYRSRLAERFRAWMRARGLEAPATIDFTKKSGAMSEFLTEVMAQYFEQMRDHLRSLGVRIPVNGTNWSINSALLVAMKGMDLCDSHAYQCHPSQSGSFGNVPLVSGPPGAFCAWLAFNRVAGKPFCCSEWNEPWPNEWRAEMPLHLAYIAALQGWDGMAIYTYHHSATPPPAHISGWFETFNDPALFGLFPHAALLFRRGDAAGAKARVGVELGERDELTSSPVGAGSAARNALSNIERHRMEVLLPGQDGAGFDNVLRYDSGASRSSPVRSDTGEYERQFEPERQTGRAVIDTPRTQAAYGFWDDRRPADLAAVRFDIATDFAVVAVSSLTDDPIADSDDLLMTAVGRAENNDQLFDVTHQSLVSRGGAPIMVEPIRGSVVIKTARRDLRCYAIDASGRVLAETAVSPTSDGFAVDLEAGEKTVYWRITSRDLRAE